MAHIRINNHWVDVPTPATEQDIRRVANINPSRRLLHRQGRSHQLVPRGAVLTVADGDTFLDAPARIKGASRMRVTTLLGESLANFIERVLQSGPEAPIDATDSQPTPEPPHEVVADRRSRIVAEITMVAPQFERHGEVSWDNTGAHWVMLTRYPLPDRWETRWAQLLILFPATYPATPPLGFYLDHQMRVRNAGRDPHLTGQAHGTAPDLRAQGWEWYCVHVVDGAGGWRPSSDWRKPDNLRTYMRLIRDVLTNEE